MDNGVQWYTSFASILYVLLIVSVLSSRLFSHPCNFSSAWLLFFFKWNGHCHQGLFSMECWQFEFSHLPARKVGRKVQCITPLCKAKKICLLVKLADNAFWFCTAEHPIWQTRDADPIMSACWARVGVCKVNPLTAGPEYIRFLVFYYHITYHSLSILKIKCDIKSARFRKSRPPFCQILIIFTHMKLWIASARHNFKWMEIPIE